MGAQVALLGSPSLQVVLRSNTLDYTRASSIGNSGLGVSIFRQDLALAKQAHGGGGSNGKWQGDPAPLKLHLFQYT